MCKYIYVSVCFQFFCLPFSSLQVFDRFLFGSSLFASDHRIFSTTIKLSLRQQKFSPSKRLNWQALRNDEDLRSLIGTFIINKYNELPVESQNYSEFLRLSNQEGLKLLPKRNKKPSLSDEDTLPNHRKESINAPINDIQAKQRLLHSALDEFEEKRINETLKLFENKSANDS